VFLAENCPTPAPWHNLIPNGEGRKKCNWGYVLGEESSERDTLPH